MAEQGTAADDKGKATGAGQAAGTGAAADEQKAITPTEHRAVFEAELGKTDAPAGATGAATNDKRPDQAAEGGTTGAGGTNAANSDSPDPNKPSLTDDDRAILKEYGIKEDDAMAGTFLSAVKHERTERANAENNARRYASQNQQLSGQYKSLKTAHDEIMKQQTPADRAKGIVGRIDKTKLSPNAVRLLEDPDMMEFMGAFMDAAAPKAEGAGALQTGGGFQDGKQPETVVEMGKLTPEQQTEVAGRFESAMTEAGHKDFMQVYGTPDYEGWLRQTVESEVKQNARMYPTGSDPMMLSPTLRAWMSLDPAAHVNVLTRYQQFQVAKKAAADDEKGRKQQLKDMAGAGAVGKGGGTFDDMTPDDILNMGKEQFSAFDQRVRTAGARR